MRPTISLLLGCAVLVGMPEVARAQIFDRASGRKILSASGVRSGAALGEGVIGPTAPARGTLAGDEGRLIKKGALVGLVVGAIAFPTYEGIRQERICGPVRGTIHACDDERSAITIVFVCGSVGAAVGAAIGAAVGAAIAHRRSALPSRRVSSKFVVGPFAERSRTGIVFSIAF